MTTPLLAVYGTHRAVQTMTVRDVQRLSVLYYAFCVVEDDGTLTLAHKEDIALFKEFRRINPGLKILLSIGGGGQNGLSAATADPGRCEQLAEDLAGIMTENGFDGLDLDWEFPTVNGDLTERDRHTCLLAALRRAMDRCPGGHRLLIIAAPSGEWCFQVLDLERSVAYLDYVNLMTYDMAVNRGITCHHTAPLRQSPAPVADASAADNVDIFLSHGIPKEKLIIGAAFYSRQWSGLPDKDHGLFLPVCRDSDYGPSYAELTRRFINKNGFVRYWDEEANAPYLFNGDTFITYDDPDSLAVKCRLVSDRQLAGVMAWEYSYDETHELLEALYRQLYSGGRQNDL